MRDTQGFPGGASGKEPACQCRRRKRHRFNPWVGKIPWRRKWQPTPVFLPRESHGQGAWRATVHRVAQSQTQLKQLSTCHRALRIRVSGDGTLCIQTNKQTLVDESSWLRNSYFKKMHVILSNYACFNFSGLMWQPKNIGSMAFLSRIQKSLISQTMSCVSSFWYVSQGACLKMSISGGFIHMTLYS